MDILNNNNYPVAINFSVYLGVQKIREVLNNPPESINMDSIMKHLLLILVILAGCGQVKTHQEAIEYGIYSNQIKPGATKVKVNEIVTPAHPWCVKTKTTEDHVYELWDFATRDCGFNWTKSYALLFRDGKLIEIRQVTSVLDLQVP